MAKFSASTTLFSLIAIVPLRECNIPTLIVSPLVAADATGDAAVDDTADGLSAVVLVPLLAQAFRRKLVPKVAVP